MLKSKFKKVIMSKQVILMLLVFIVLGAGVTNWVNERGLNDVMETSGADVVPVEEEPVFDYFAQAISERDSARGQALEILEKDKSAKATDEVAQIAKNMQNEATIESLIKSKGFEKAVAYVTADSANIIVKAQGLTAAQVAQIRDIVISQTGVSAANIKIAEISG